MKQNISVIRGTNCMFGLVITNADGTPFSLSGGQALTFAVKKRPTDEERVLVKKVTNSVSAGTFYLELVPADTSELEPGRYFYDVGLQSGSSFYNVIEASELDIKPNISELGDGF